MTPRTSDEGRGDPPPRRGSGRRPGGKEPLGWPFGRRELGIAVVAVLFVVTAFVVLSRGALPAPPNHDSTSVAAAGQPSRSPDTPRSAKPPAAAARTKSASRPSTASHRTTPASARPADSERDALRRWHDDVAVPMIADLDKLAQLRQGSGADRTADVLRALCTRLSTLRAQAAGSPPPEGTLVTEEWSTGVDKLGDSAATCANTNRSSSPDDLKSAAADLRSAREHFSSAAQAAGRLVAQ